MNSLKTRKMAPALIQDMLHPPEKQKKRTVKQAIIELIQVDPTVDDFKILTNLKAQGMKCTKRYVGQVRNEAGIVLD